MAILRAHTMARPYSDDLRQKLLEAYDQGQGSLAELAEQFCVSLGWAWKISSARKRTGRTERASYRPGPKRREAFVEALRTITLEKLIFLDESGVSTQMTRLYARATGGSRIAEAAPHCQWKILTILGAISTRGMIATMTIEAATARE